jgi:hypothetical protein
MKQSAKYVIIELKNIQNIAKYATDVATNLITIVTG